MSLSCDRLRKRNITVVCQPVQDVPASELAVADVYHFWASEYIQWPGIILQALSDAHDRVLRRTTATPKFHTTLTYPQLPTCSL